ncbi:hypothetical protein BG20_I2426 [Candidatus Nitrosarchaeum limnium BG20]|uniref:Uncharacterized protein n=1 Tax=Candidatus Nitrosarchaeum limnium BG20 TaxID=859192 RepID=S2E6P1_9ARCH|nr:hypothetical protein BG20_I2426 [Candidatus Nitrosarchaeum limnium BG20]
MGEIHEVSKKIKSLCANCGHIEWNHIKTKNVINQEYPIQNPILQNVTNAKKKVKLVRDLKQKRQV